MKRTLLFIMSVLASLTMSAQEELTVEDIQNSGCLKMTLEERFQSLPTIVLTKEGCVLSVQLLNYETYDATTDFNVTSLISDDDPCSVTINITPVIPVGAQVFREWVCLFNVSFTVRDLEPNRFYLDCWWFKGLVELTEGEPLVLENKIKTDVKINETTFPDEDFRNWVLSQEFGKDEILTEEEIAGVTIVNLFPQNIIAEGHIKSLKGIEYFTAMTKLVCSRNELTELELSKNTAMTWLECDGNHLMELDLSKNTELSYLDCQSNELTALNVLGCTKLTELNCFGNQLTKLNVSGCCVLTMLKCYYNPLTELDVSGCTSLKTMWVFNNQLTALDVSDCNSLSILRCENNQLTQLDVSTSPILTELWCSDNQLTALDLSKNQMLTTLRTYHNPIKGEAMDALIESLPTVSRGGWCCVLSKNEEGTVTTTQVAVAKAKGWTSYYWNETTKNWMEYAGSEPTQDDYRPFIEEGKVWKVGGLGSGNPVQFVEYYYFDGDTIIGGKTCKQMMCQRFVTPEHPDYAIIMQYPLLRSVGAWYEENKKVYTYDTTNKRFKMKYDFSLEANDTLLIDNCYPYIIGPKQTGGLKGFKGVYRDIMWCGEESNHYCTTWLEGVGGIDGPTVNVYYGEENHTLFLMSCTVGDEVIYLNDLWEDGATPEVLEARKQRIDFTHTIKTRPRAPRREPTSDPSLLRGETEGDQLYGEYNNLQLDINLNPLADAYQVSITDETGKAVYEKNVNAASIVGLNIDISSYPAGRYTVIVENSSESFTGVFDTITTGISDAERLNDNGEMINDIIYNLQGQRIRSLQKGLNIVNGQKVYVK